MTAAKCKKNSDDNSRLFNLPGSISDLEAERTRLGGPTEKQV
jgi:hypothetical protein